MFLPHSLALQERSLRQEERSSSLFPRSVASQKRSSGQEDGSSWMEERLAAACEGSVVLRECLVREGEVSVVLHGGLLVLQGLAMLFCISGLQNGCEESKLYSRVLCKGDIHDDRMGKCRA